ncbi:MAG: hypothetical protein ABIL58_16650 [Pseudomonadota bacterium]
MFANLTKGLLAAIAIKQIDNCRRLSIQLLKIEAVTGYLHGVQMARLTVIGLMRMGLLIGFIGFGMLLLHAGLFILLPWSVETKAVLGIFLGLAYMTIGSIVLHLSVDEKRWMKKSGVAEMLEKVTTQ